MTETDLTPHATQLPPPRIGVAAAVERRVDGSLAARFRLSGELALVRVPPRQGARRADRLWEHTCFELFVGASGEARYLEFNFSPSGEWAAYAFDDYRRDMRPLALAEAPAVGTEACGRELVVTVSVAVGAFLPPASMWRVGLTAVIEGVSGERSYWALRHPAASPDFHAAAGWVAELREHAG